MANEKLTAKKGLVIVLGMVLIPLYFIIFFSSLIFTGNGTVSLILSTSITFALLTAWGYTWKRRKEYVRMMLGITATLIGIIWIYFSGSWFQAFAGLIWMILGLVQTLYYCVRTSQS